MLEAISSFLDKFGAMFVIGLSWVVVLVAWWRTRRAWREKRFANQVTFSLNRVSVSGHLDSQLDLRTLMETTADALWNNELAVNLVMDAAKETTVAQPFISLKDDADMGYILRGILNKLSEKFAVSFIADAVGLQTVTDKFVFGLTCEKYGDTPTQKVRVMIVPERTLAEWFASDTMKSPDGLQVSAPTHRARIETLKVMARLYNSTKREERRCLSTIELGVPA